MRARKRRLLGALFAAIVGTTVAVAEDDEKSAVKPAVLSLPSGPGSIEGLGESFELLGNTGLATHRVRLELPPGRAGFAPELALDYDSGGRAGIAGLGWSLELPELRRRTDRGIPLYADDDGPNGLDDDSDGSIDEFDEQDTVTDEEGEELVRLADGSWRAENEGAFTKYQRLAEGWSAKRRDGVTLLFGSVSDARVSDGSTREFAWRVTRMTDPSGNAIQFIWVHLDGSRQVYLERIAYNPSDGSGMTVEFDYEARPDLISDRRPGFEVVTAYRLARISMKRAGELVRAYELVYEPVTDLRPVSLLRSVARVGRDGTSRLPPANFYYTTYGPESAQQLAVTSGPALSVGDPDIDLMDVDGDALPDILDTRSAAVLGHQYYSNLGPGPDGTIAWADVASPLPGAPFHLGSETVQLADFDGDARADLLWDFGPAAEMYSVVDQPGGERNWVFAGYMLEAGFDFRFDPNVTLLDVSGDGVTDVLKTDPAVYTVWIAHAEGTWGLPIEQPPAAPGLLFEDPTTRVADMNGDGLMDLVRLRDEICIYWPGAGRGLFGPAITVRGAPGAVVDEANLLLVDVNGDGRADVVHVRGGAADVYLNLGLDPQLPSEARFASAFTLSGPPTTSATVFREADCNGNGSHDILWNSYPDLVPSWTCLDFSAGEQPYVLRAMENGIGGRTTLTYASAVEVQLAEAAGGSPWTTNLPVPVQVVRSAVSDDGLDEVHERREFSYGDPFYDAAEREFRGFARVEQRRVGDGSTPTLLERRSFDTGRAHDAFRGLVTREELRDPTAGLFHATDYTYTLRTLAPSGSPGDPRSVAWAPNTAKVQAWVELGAGTPVRLEWEYDYDAYGNRTLEASYGRVEDVAGRSAWDDERIVRTTYTSGYPDGLSTWILDRPVEEVTTDEHGVVSARTRHFYDDETFAGTNVGGVSRGLRTMSWRWADPNDDASIVRTERRRYDAFGNSVFQADPLWGLAPGHAIELDYDAMYRTFVSAERHVGGGVAVTLTFTAEYDPGLGKITRLTDMANATTRVAYDPFGRVTAVAKPGDDLALPTLEYVYALQVPVGGDHVVNWVETRQREQSGSAGAIVSREFSDGFGRRIMKRAESGLAGAVTVSEAVSRDAQGEVAREHLAYYDSGSNAVLDYRPPAASAAARDTLHDALGRPVRITEPAPLDGAPRPYSERRYEPLLEVWSDDEQTRTGSPHQGAALLLVRDGLPESAKEDAPFRLRRVTQRVRVTSSGGVPEIPLDWTTTYDYDVLGNLSRIADAHANLTTRTYDGLSRLFFEDQPDRGWRWLAYDPASNVVRTRDAGGREIARTYDAHGRPLDEFFCVAGEETGASLQPGQRWAEPGDPPDRLPDLARHYDVPAGPLEVGVDDPRLPTEIVLDMILGRLPESPAGDLDRDGSIDVADVVLSVSRADSVPLIPEIVLAANTAGRLSWVRDETGEHHYSYDARGQVEWNAEFLRTALSGSVRQSFLERYQHDAADRLVRTRTPDGTLLQNEYDPGGLLQSIGSAVAGITYTAFGSVAGAGTAVGSRVDRTYDRRERPRSIRWSRTADQSAIVDLAYDLDGVGNVLGIADRRSPTEFARIAADLGRPESESAGWHEDRTAWFDDAYRLRSVATGDGSVVQAFAFDVIGNRVFAGASGPGTTDELSLGAASFGDEVSGGGGRFNRTGRPPGASPGPHAITGSESGGTGGGPLAWTYDSPGRLVSNGGRTFEWDHRGRLVRIVAGDVVLESRYDHQGRVRLTEIRTAGELVESRVRVTDAFEIWNGQAWKWVRLGGERVCRDVSQVAAERPFVADTCAGDDMRRSVLTVVAANGRVAGLNSFHAFGQRRVRIVEGISAWPVGFEGKQDEDLVSLIDFGARMLDPRAGAMASPDLVLGVEEMALDAPLTLNPYAFERGNPLSRVDMSGNIDGWAFAGGTVMTAGGIAVIAGLAIAAAPVTALGALVLAVSAISAAGSVAGGTALMITAAIDKPGGVESTKKAIDHMTISGVTGVFASAAFGWDQERTVSSFNVIESCLSVRDLRSLTKLGEKATKIERAIAFGETLGGGQGLTDAASSAADGLVDVLPPLPIGGSPSSSSSTGPRSISGLKHFE